MTVENFQSLLAELVADGTVDPHRVEGLTTLEKQRFKMVSEQPGVGVMRTLYFSWRLTKILTLLPLTAALIRHEKLANHLHRFWSIRKATSLYFVDECLAFLSFLEDDLGETLPYMEEVLGFERARLELRLELSKGQNPQPRQVHFRCNPSALFEALEKGADLSDLPVLDVVLQGSLTPDGREYWTMALEGQAVRLL